jgi:Flp pilus assembly protein TadG
LIRRHRRPQSPTSRPGRGQALVEFALVFPLFIVLLLGIIEFAFLFNALLSVNYAARDAALAAAEAGDGAGADCVILQSVDRSVGPPAVEGRIGTVEIYQATPNGAMIGSPTTYTRTGSTTCTFVDGTSVTVPYTRSSNNYAEANRCNILGGCGVGHPTVDNVAVRVSYTHTWVTPLQNFLGGGSGLTFDRSSVMRMEPIL